MLLRDAHLLRSVTKLRHGVGGHKSRRILFSEVKSGGRGIRTHGDVAATMVFRRIGGSWSIIVATCVVGTRGWPAGQDHPANIPRPVQMCPVGMPHELRIVRVFSCVARGFKACPSFMFAGYSWWGSLAVDGGSGASRGHALVLRRPGSRPGGAVERPSVFLGRTWPHVAMRYLSVGPCCRAPLLAICCCCCCRLGRGRCRCRCRPGVDHGSSGHKVTARWTASWITELSRSARVSATSCSSQDATKVTGPSGGSG